MISISSWLQNRLGSRLGGVTPPSSLLSLAAELNISTQLISTVLITILITHMLIPLLIKESDLGESNRIKQTPGPRSSFWGQQLTKLSRETQFLHYDYELYMIPFDQHKLTSRQPYQYPSSLCSHPNSLHLFYPSSGSLQTPYPLSAY